MRTLLSPALLLQVLIAASCVRPNAGAPPRAVGPYFGLRLPRDTPEVFAPGIVSTAAFEHSRLLVSKDGRTFYWAAQPEGSSNGILDQAIWRMHQGADGWSSPEPLPVPLIGLASPALSPDGKVLYFTSIANTPGVDRDHRAHHVNALSVDSAEVEDVTSQLAPLAKSWSFSIADNGNIYFDSRDSTDSGWALYVMERTGGRYAPPRKLGGAVNSGTVDVHPCIAPDERFLVFSSFRPGGHGIADLYVSFRGSDGDWTPARNLGPTVNSAILERFPSLSPDGRFLFFTRNGGAGVSDFFWVGTSVLDRLR